MKDLTRRVKAFFKSGVREVRLFLTKHRKTIFKVLGRIVIFVIKMIIESKHEGLL